MEKVVPSTQLHVWFYFKVIFRKWWTTFYVCKFTMREFIGTMKFNGWILSMDIQWVAWLEKIQYFQWEKDDTPHTLYICATCFVKDNFGEFIKWHVLVQLLVSKQDRKVWWMIKLWIIITYNTRLILKHTF